jgi:tetratricopeptide (TPR) repeat protein
MKTGGARFRGQILAVSFLVLALESAIPRLPAQNDDLNKTRNIAAAQHDIVIILIKKRDFAKAAEEANKIFQMKWPDDQEPVLLKALLGFSDLFRHNNQPAIALRLLDANLNLFKANQSKAEILKDKGYLLEVMGQHDKALDCFREVKRLLEIKSPPPKPAIQTPPQKNSHE